VRILLTGYADLDAIEGSINIGEVFRFLSKPCPPQQLRETLAEAVQAARESGAAARAAAVVEAAPAPPERRAATRPPAAAPAPARSAAAPENHVATVPNLALELEKQEQPAPAPSAPGEEPADEVIVLSSEPHEPEGETIVLASEPEEPEEEEAIVLSSGPGDTEEAAADEIVLASDREPDFVDTIVIGDDTGSGRSGACADMDRVGVALFTSDAAFAERVKQVLGERYRVTHASTLVQVTELLSDAGAGVLVTDFCTDGAMLRNMLSTLKRYLPELITIVVSEERDAAEMISLINHGQVFRYMSKPMDEARLVQNVNAAVLRHIQLLENPELAQRHSVVPDRAPRQAAALLAQFVNRVRGMRRLWVRS
jgi:FixJ family two-component response regulator